MNRIFVDREKELSFLERKYEEEGFQLIALYGRRRTGKTELLSRFLHGKKGIYYLADKRGTSLNSRLFAEEAAMALGDIVPAVTGFEDVFDYIIKKVNRGENVVVVIDEFSYLIEKDDSLPSLFQKICDNKLKGRSMMLVLCGSSIGMMEKGVLSYKSPLYGRRTGEWKLNPLKYLDATGFFPKYGIEDKAAAVMILGGIPAYLMEFDDSSTIYENIKNKLLSKGEVLYNEVNMMLQMELRDPATYMRILDSMSKGATKVVDIANRSYLAAKDLPKYLAVLQKLEYVKRLHPVTEKKPKSKKTIYRISDNFFRFWFNFVDANKSELELGMADAVLEKVKSELNQFLGLSFEQFCEEAITNLTLPLRPTKIGTWWSKGGEIDLVCLDESKKEALFLECKWSVLGKVEARRILYELKEKSKFVEWDRKNEYFGLICKKFLGGFKEELRNEGFLAFDLHDMFGN